MGNAASSANENLDRINRPTWAAFVDEFVSADSWTDAGERNLLNMLAPTVRGSRILDIGVGAGRTAWILPLLTDAYVAIDYTPEMVEAAKRTHPNSDIRVGDARALRDFSDGSFDFVMFSFNGIDALAHDDRATALAEVRRVLTPGGTFMFSTLDKNGRNFRQPPSAFGKGDERQSRLSTVARLAFHAPSRIAKYRREHANWRKLSPLIEDHGSWGIGPLAAQDYGLLVHFITPEGQRNELESLGFRVTVMVDDHGSEVTDSQPARDRSFFHVVATTT